MSTKRNRRTKKKTPSQVDGVQSDNPGNTSDTTPTPAACRVNGVTKAAATAADVISPPPVDKQGGKKRKVEDTPTPHAVGGGVGSNGPLEQAGTGVDTDPARGRPVGQPRKKRGKKEVEESDDDDEERAVVTPSHIQSLLRRTFTFGSSPPNSTGLSVKFSHQFANHTFTFV